MKRNAHRRSTRDLEAVVTSPPAEEYFLRLYVAGASSRSRRAILRARELCAGELKGHCRLEVVDIYQEPIRARQGQIVATPTLVKEFPLPARRVIGTPDRSRSLFVGLGLAEADDCGS